MVVTTFLPRKHIFIVKHRHQMRDTDIKYEAEVERCAEYILEHKAGWTQFTSWYTERKGIGHTKANRMWKKAMAKVSEVIDDTIKGHVDKAMVELENLKERARQENERNRYRNGN